MTQVPIFHYSQPVYFSDVDIGGVLYHPRYLDYYDRARNAAIKEKGISYLEFIRSGYALVVADAHIKYLRSVSFEQEIHIYSRFLKISNRSVTAEQIMSTQILAPAELDDAFATKKHLINYLTVVWVCVKLNEMKSCTIPEEVKAKLV